MEGLPFFKKASAEKDVLIDPESGYFTAQNFVHDPVGFLEELRIDLVEQEGYQGFDLVNTAIAEIEEVRDVVSNESIQVENETVQAVLKSEYLSYDWAKAVFDLLMQASYSEHEISEWILNRNHGLSSDEELNERAMGRALKEVYDQ